MVGQQVEHPPHGEVDGEEEYKVRCVEDSKIYQNQLQYMIWWMGYESLTWKPAKWVGGFQAVVQFHQI